MNKILISYRREDSADVTGRIYDRLVQSFPKAVFRDVDSIPLGADFREQLDKEVAKCDVFLAVIGPDWMGPKDSAGKTRLEDPKDFVRIEIESALNRQIPVIPVLVKGTLIPSSTQLPRSLQELSYRQGVAIRSDPDFHHDMDRLIEHLKAQLEVSSAGGGESTSHSTLTSRTTTDWSQSYFLGGIALIALIGAVVMFQIFQSKPSAVEPSTPVPRQSPPFSAQQPPFKLVGLAGKCLDASEGSSANGTPIILFDCTEGLNQLWNSPDRHQLDIIRKDKVATRITGVSGKCLDVTGGNPANGMPIQLWDCNGGPNQKWLLEDNESIKGLANKCLDVAGGNSSNGTRIILWDCTGGANQRWSIRNK